MDEVKVSTFAEMQAASAAAPEAGQNQTETTVTTEQATTAAIAATETSIAASTIEPATTEFDFELPDIATGEAAAQQQQGAPVTSWKDAIKEVDRAELLKEAGLDDFTIQLAQHLKNGGSAEDYLQAKAVDWSKVSDTDLAKQALKDEFPDATQAQIDRLFNKKYSQHDLAEDEDREDGLLLMKNDARKQRAQRIEHQAKFQIATPQQQAQTQQQQLQIPPEVQQYADGIFKSTLLQDIKQNKRVDIALPNGNTFKFGLKQPDLIQELIFNPELQRKLNLTQTGEPDMQKITEKALFSLYPNEYKQQLFNAGREDYKKQMIAEGQNIGIKPTPAGGATDGNLTMKQGFQQARVTTYGG